jgi:LmbE family N-acetylglucosaminyl deacetylase
MDRSPITEPKREKSVTEEITETLDRVMVIAAHPDDMEFGCGGAIAKLADAGKEVTLLLLTSGDKGSHDHTLRPDKLAGQREVEQRAANVELGIKHVLFLRHPDGLLENNMFLRRQLADIIRRHKPHIVFAIDPWRRYQLHPDHRAAGQAALDAIWAAREWNIFPEQLQDGEEPWRVKEVYLFWTDHVDYYEDVTSSIDKRIAALACHVSQVGEDRAKLDERMRERCRKTAEEGGEATAGFNYAEAYKKFQF